MNRKQMKYKLSVNEFSHIIESQRNVFYDSLCVKESYGTFEITFTGVSQVANLLPISNKISIDKNKQLYYSFFYIDVLFKDNQ